MSNTVNSHACTQAQADDATNEINYYTYFHRSGCCTWGAQWNYTTHILLQQQSHQHLWSFYRIQSRRQKRKQSKKFTNNNYRGVQNWQQNFPILRRLIARFHISSMALRAVSACENEFCLSAIIYSISGRLEASRMIEGINIDSCLFEAKLYPDHH